MTQRIFDIENEKDMQDLWNILPDWAQKIKKNKSEHQYAGIFAKNEAMAIDSCIFKINWHDKTEITRPIQEATKQDIGKICRFCNYEGASNYFGILCKLREMPAGTRFIAKGCNGEHPFVHAYRLTKQEIEELC